MTRKLDIFQNKFPVLFNGYAMQIRIHIKTLANICKEEQRANDEPGAGMTREDGEKVIEVGR